MKKTITIFLISIFLCICKYATAAELTITGTTGTFTHSAEITVSGINLGENLSLSNVVWDAFEDGTIDTTADVGSWQTQNIADITTSGNRHSNSTYHGTENFTTEQTAGVTSLNTVTSRKWFVQYWFEIDDNWDWGTSVYSGGDQFLSNVKFLRFWNSSGSIDENWYSQYWFGVDSNSYTDVENVSGESSTNFSTTWSKSSATKGTWHCLQCEFSESGVNQSDGIIRIWMDGVLRTERTNVKTREDFSEYKRVNLLGFYNAWTATGDSEGNQAPNTFRIDDVYCSPSWSRVEIGNASTFNSCTHREIQIPHHWSSSSIGITVNRGSFAEDAKAYLFVIDSDGNISDADADADGEQGYPITFGGEGGTTPAISSANGTYNQGETINLYGSNFQSERGNGKVWLCDNTTYGGSTIVNNQTITTWSDTAIVFEFDETWFTDGETAYLIVEDNNGNFSTSYQIQLYSAPSYLPNAQDTVSGGVQISGGCNVS